MDTIVYRDGIPCKLVKDGYHVSVWESKTHTLEVPTGRSDGSMIDLTALRGPVGGWHGTGQREIRITRRLLAIPLSEDRHLLDAWNPLTGERFDWDVDVNLVDLEERAERSRKKSQQRAKRMCRHKIKHGGFRHMLTGTYRDNMIDFDRMHKDFAAWLRKMRAIVPGFRTVYGLETQKRGAWHFHATIDSLPRFLRYKGQQRPSYEVCTLLWREVVGDVAMVFEGPLQPGQQWPVVMVSGGTINVDGHVKQTRKKQHADAKAQSLAKMAQYVSKYLTKDHDKGLRGRRMWGSTEDLTPPKAIRYQFAECDITDLIAAVFELPPGHRVASHWMNSFADCWVLDTEPIPL